MKLLLIKLTLLVSLVGITIGITSRPVEHQVAHHVVKLSDKGGSGTGFYVLYKGQSFLISNKHVCGKSDSMLANGKLLKVLVVSKVHDLCLLESDRIGGLRMAINEPKSLDELIVIGHPLGQPITLRAGRLVDKPIEAFPWLGSSPVRVFHVSITVFGGNSGSPLVNTEGHLVGVIFASNMRTYHDAYAVPLEDLKLFLEEVIK